jgi:hypothetical protein
LDDSNERKQMQDLPEWDKEAKNTFSHFPFSFACFRFGLVGFAPGLDISAMGLAFRSRRSASFSSGGMWTLSARRGILLIILAISAEGYWSSCRWPAC